MADDIVHRLQVEIDFDGDDPLPLLVDAKAEIERLRAALRTAAATSHGCLTGFFPCWCEEARRG